MPIPKPYAPTGTKKGEGEDEGCQYHCRALWQCFRSQRWITGEWTLENRQFLAKMHQIAPNCVSNFKIFPGVPRTPIPGRGHLPRPRPLSAAESPLGASSLDPLDHPPDSFIPPLKQTAGRSPGIERKSNMKIHLKRKLCILLVVVTAIS